MDAIGARKKCDEKGLSAISYDETRAIEKKLDKNFMSKYGLTFTEIHYEIMENGKSDNKKKTSRKTEKQKVKIIAVKVIRGIAEKWKHVLR